MLRILYLENDPDDVEQLRRLLVEEMRQFDYVPVADADRYRRAVPQGPYDLILCDCDVPDISATTALQLARKHSPHAPFVFLSRRISPGEVLNGVRLGADDVIAKSDLQRLLQIVRRTSFRKASVNPAHLRPQAPR